MALRPMIWLRTEENPPFVALKLPVRTTQDQKDWEEIRQMGPTSKDQVGLTKLFPNVYLVVEAVFADPKQFEGFYYTGEVE